MSDAPPPPASVETIVSQIYTINGLRVMLDSDLARLYGVQTRVLTQAIKRNAEKFPTDFMFQLTREQWDSLKSQLVISSGHGGRRTQPRVFTEHGAFQLANVLRSKQAVDLGICVVRAFVQQRQLIANQETIRRWLLEMQNQLDGHEQKLASLDERNEKLLILLSEFSRLLPTPDNKKKPEPFGFIQGTSQGSKRSKSQKSPETTEE